MANNYIRTVKKCDVEGLKSVHPTSPCPFPRALGSPLHFSDRSLAAPRPAKELLHRAFFKHDGRAEIPGEACAWIMSVSVTLAR